MPQAGFVLKIGSQRQRQGHAALSQTHRLQLLLPFGCDAGADQ